MSAKSCSACNDLREYAPEFVTNGVTDNVAENLRNDSGLSGADGHVDCEDLLDVNDCLVGNMLDELDAYDVCEWKDFMAAFIGNMYETIKAMVYSQCGQWCSINGLYNGATFHIGEDTSGDAYAVAGKGVSFLIPLDSGGGDHIVDLTMDYVAGGLVVMNGSYRFYNENFTDSGACCNFDNGSTEQVSQNRLGNSFWGTTSSTGTFPGGGELICEYRIKRSAYPQIRTFFQGFGQETGGGDYKVRAVYFSAGYYAWGQHGWCNNNTGAPSESGYSSGHLVPSGWMYIQLRMSSADKFPVAAGGQQYTPYAFMGIRMNQDEIEC